MRFGFSYIGLIWLIMLFVPNMIWTKNKPQDYEKYVESENKVLLAMERLGQFIVTPVSLGILLAAYWLSFASYMKRRTVRLALVLAILPVCIFLFSGILLRHWLLVCSAVLFAVGHIYVTYRNAIYIKNRN